jgi:cold shock CspA family protein
MGQRQKQMKEVGVVMTWFTDRGFGWVHRVVEGEVRGYFTHISQCNGIPKVGDVVHFNIGVGRGSRGPVAKNVEIVGGAQ